MCITIPSSAHVKRARQWILWQWLAATPLRLLGFGAVTAFIAGLVHHYVFPGGLSSAWTGYNLLFGVMPWLLFAVSFEFTPGWLKVTPPRYASYGLLFFVLLLSQLLFHLSGMTPGGVGMLYLLSLWLAWAMALSTLKGLLNGSYRRDIAPLRALYLLLLAMGLAAPICGCYLLWG